MAHSPVVDKGRPRKAQDEMPTELPRVGRVQFINPVRLQIQLKVLAACQVTMGNCFADLVHDRKVTCSRCCSLSRKRMQRVRRHKVEQRLETSIDLRMQSATAHNVVHSKQLNLAETAAVL